MMIRKQSVCTRTFGASLSAVLVFALMAAAVTPVRGMDDQTVPLPAHPNEIVFPELVYNPPEADSFRTVLPCGVPCYLMPSPIVPLVKMRIYVRVDSRLEPRGKTGLHGAAFQLLTSSGSGTRSAAEIEEEVDYLGAWLYSGTDGYGGRIDLDILSKDIETGLDILFEVLRGPAYEDERVSIWREKKLNRLREGNDTSQAVERTEWRRLFYHPDDPMGRFPTRASIEAINGEALKKWHSRWVKPGNFLVAASGDFDREKFSAGLEKRFSGWEGETVPFDEPVHKYNVVRPGVYIVHKDFNQTRVKFTLPGLDRDDPGWLAAKMMMNLFGSSGMGSRLFNSIRSEEGLAYSVYSYLQEESFGPGLLIGAFQTKVESTIKAMAIVPDEMKKLKEGGVTPKELEDIINAEVESFPARFPDPAAIVRKFANEELSGRRETDPAYHALYRDRIRKLTARDLNKAAAELLSPDSLVWLVIADTTALFGGSDGNGRELLAEFGPVTILPLRDPLTGEPIE